jgi:GH25 family lysozyme M1 (1,4-beta-N-acetylmuramidase)
MTRIHGVDVAGYQPKTFSTSGLSFVFVKTSEGTSYTNPFYKDQIATSRRGQSVTGHYHFLHAGNVSAQVAYFISRADVKPGELIVCDWEGLNGAWPSNSDKDTFLKALKAKFPNNRVGLYTNLDGWKVHDHTSYCADFLWIADPGQAAPRIQHNWTFWQIGTTDIGGHKFDYDVANFETLSALRTWAQFPVETTPTPTVATPEYRAVFLNDVFPTPEGHTDSGGTGQWTVQTLLSSLYSFVADNNKLLRQIIAEIEAEKAPSEVPDEK